jgi:NhaP-type Na+/H+ or K+/H+ antiporter
VLIGNWIAERRASFGSLSLARKGSVAGLLLVLGFALGFTVRAVGFDRTSFLQCALVGVLCGVVLGFGGLIFASFLSQRPNPGKNNR